MFKVIKSLEVEETLVNGCVGIRRKRLPMPIVVMG
jgi:hypothetical protein